MRLHNGRVIVPTPQETSIISANKMPSGTPAHHRHATPKPTVAERPHGHREAPQQMISMTHVMPGDSPFVTLDQFQSAMSVIRTAIGGTVESGATIPILPEDGSTMQAFLLRVERRYTQMGLEPREWGNALIDHLVGPALTYWMYLRRTIDLCDWATVRRRLLERFDKTMSQSQLLTEFARVRWNGNPNEYLDRFAAVAERGLGVAPDELADYYCTRLPTDLHLPITNNGQVKYQSWEQAATAAARLYEPTQSVLELRQRTSRAIRAAIQANGPRRRQEIENRPGGTHANCSECQGRGHPTRLCPSKGERTKRPGEICKKCGGVGHYARDCPTYERGRPEPGDKSSREPTRPSTEKTERLNRGPRRGWRRAF
ncbi:hypothetical protein, conserved [Eimeria tenella]|uniref:CCHC-type domain-containing protein n=1 Tax=Eimeria tenella TaxID=5802 RepID=U6KY02_EIMTE|nr:hypothetical protein, conserved [Eimeria tenella]CDJ43022.1 hypothetical protein, conserved [Eimeria tenella]|eukprot:XP_013233772.1 hypothetical protein, conserved [Eimeria tenella]